MKHSLVRTWVVIAVTASCADPSTTEVTSALTGSGSGSGSGNANLRPPTPTAAPSLVAYCSITLDGKLVSTCPSPRFTGSVPTLSASDLRFNSQPTSVHLYADGADVTNAFTLQVAFGTYGVEGAVAPGLHSFTVRYVDANGNEGGDSPATQLTTGRAFVTASLRASDDSGDSDSDGITNVASPTIVGRTDASATAWLTDCADPPNQVAQLTVDVGGNFAQTVGPLADGRYCYRAMSTVNGTSVVSGDVRLVIDTQPPPLTDVNIIRPGTLANATWVATTWSIRTYVDVPVSLDTITHVTVGVGTMPLLADIVQWTDAGGPVGYTNLDGSGDSSWFNEYQLVRPLATGTTFYLTAFATDVAGNTTWMASAGTTVDWSAPTRGTVNFGDPTQPAAVPWLTTASNGAVTISINWTGIMDLQSGIAGWRVAVTDGTNTTWRPASPAFYRGQNYATFTVDSLDAGGTYSVLVEATNGAGSTATSQSGTFFYGGGNLYNGYGP